MRRTRIIYITLGIMILLTLIGNVIANDNLIYQEQICYQEHAHLKTCGNDRNGSYNGLSGNAIDGDWSTYLDGTGSVTYIVPNGTSISSKLNLKTQYYVYQNLSMESYRECWGSNVTITYSKPAGNVDYFYCLNHTSNNNILMKSYNFAASHYYYEDGFLWNNITKNNYTNTTTIITGAIENKNNKIRVNTSMIYAKGMFNVTITNRTATIYNITLKIYNQTVIEANNTLNYTNRTYNLAGFINNITSLCYIYEDGYCYPEIGVISNGNSTMNITDISFGNQAQYSFIDNNQNRLSPTCTVSHGILNGSYTYTTGSHNTETITCTNTGYMPYNQTYSVADGDKTFTMTRATLNLTFSQATNITLTGSTASMYWNMNSSVYKNMTDLPFGTIIITFGNSQIYSFYNDNQTSITQSLSVITTDLVKKIRIVESGTGVYQATVNLYKNSGGSLQLVTSGLTDVNGYVSLNLNDDDTYTAVVTKTGYNTKTEAKYIPVTDSDVWTLDIQKIATVGKTNHFTTNCLNKISRTTSCYFLADLYKDYTNITIMYALNGTMYVKQCFNNDYCKTDTLTLTNLNTPAVANIYLDETLWNQTLYINYYNLSSKGVQITFPSSTLKAAGNENYLYTFYVITLIIGIVIAVSFNNKVRGLGIYALLIWFGIIAIAGFPEYWLIVIPMTILLIGQELYNWVK